MKTKPIVKPPIKESLMYGDIISWKFRDTITPEHKKYAYRFSLTFSNGVIHPMQKGGFHTKTEAAKAREITISSCIQKHLYHLNIHYKNSMIFGCIIIC